MENCDTAVTFLQMFGHCHMTYVAGCVGIHKQLLKVTSWKTTCNLDFLTEDKL